MATLAALALLLASIGIFSVLSFTVQQRAREFAIRVAIGADGADIMRLVVGRGLLLTVCGLAVGVSASAALLRTMASLLFGVKPIDPVTFVVALAILGTIAMIASIAPAIRAMRADPAVTLKSE